MYLSRREIYWGIELDLRRAVPARDTLDLHRIIAITYFENTASVALLERLGMRREGHFLQNVWFGCPICPISVIALYITSGTNRYIHEQTSLSC